MKKKISCLTCSYLSSARLDGFCWQVCKHREVTEMFPDGRTLDFDEEPDPYWCPLIKPALVNTSTAIDCFDRDDLSFYSKRNELTNSCTVRVTHKPTGLQARANEFKSLVQNRHLALTRLKDMLKKTSYRNLKLV